MGGEAVRPFVRNLRQSKKDIFKRHILKTVIARLDFTPLFGFKDLIAPFQKEFLPKFPFSFKEAEPNFNADLSDLSSPKISLRNLSEIYCLETEDRKERIKFGENFVLLETEKYQSFETFSKQFCDVVRFIFSQPNTVFAPKRLGLRKACSHILEEADRLTDFAGYFNPALIQHLSVPFLNNTLSHDVHALSFKDSESEFGINLQFASEKGSIKKVTANGLLTAASRRFILDIDIFSSSLSSDLNECLASKAKMNDLNFDFFYWSIGPKLEEYLAAE